jgi:uncharacterized protein YqjF (DUF2071 family)
MAATVHPVATSGRFNEYRIGAIARQPAWDFNAAVMCMATERPVLTARWSELLVLNFEVPAELVERLAMAGTQPDLFEGRAYASIVGFRFHNARLFGIPIPGHRRFVEINLRYYVRRSVGGEVRRGVVFVREIVPRRAVAATANWLYNENYVARPMQSAVHLSGAELAAGDSIEYAWRNPQRFALRGPRIQSYWNRMGGCVASSLQAPSPGSFEEYIIEHYWGYVVARDGSTREYEVRHRPWRVAKIAAVAWNCDVAANYDAPWAEHLAVRPASTLVADGSDVQLFRGRRLT